MKTSPNNSYVTLLTDDSFLMGVQALIYSLQKHGNILPILVLYTDQVSKSTQQRLCTKFPGVILKHVPDIALPLHLHTNKTIPAGWVNSGYTKLHIFSLVEYSKLVYIDADAIVLQNIDHLFEINSDFAAAPDVFPPDRFNAGVLVIRPDSSTFSDLMKKANEYQSYDGGDTGFLNAFFPNWFHSNPENRLHFRYNAQRTMHWITNEKNPGYWEAIKPIQILHFSSNPKPWVETAKKGELEMIWWQYYIESQLG